MADGDGVVADQDFLHEQPREALAISHVQRFRRNMQSSKECRERLGETQIGRTIRDVVGDRLEL